MFRGLAGIQVELFNRQFRLKIHILWCRGDVSSFKSRRTDKEWLGMQRSNGWRSRDQALGTIQGKEVERRLRRKKQTQGRTAREAEDQERMGSLRGRGKMVFQHGVGK